MAPEGTPILARKEGKVIYSGMNNSHYGYTVVIEWADGSGGELHAHMKGPGLAVGSSVTAGTQVGEVGRTMGQDRSGNVMYMRQSAAHDHHSIFTAEAIKKVNRSRGGPIGVSGEDASNFRDPLKI